MNNDIEVARQLGRLTEAVLNVKKDVSDLKTSIQHLNCTDNERKLETLYEVYENHKTLSIRARVAVITAVITSLVALIFSLFPASSVNAAEIDVTLQWDDNADASYYIVSYGNTPGNYTNQTPQITETTTVISGLDDTLQYYFAVKAFNACGNSSDFSDEVMTNKVPGPVVNFGIMGCTTTNQ